MSYKPYQTLKTLAKRIPGVGFAYRSLRDLRYLWREPQMTPLGFRLTGSRVMITGNHESEVLNYLRKELTSTDVFVDVGANVGLYCCLALSMGVPTIAVEPISLNLRYLLRNIVANGWENRCEIFPLALGKAPAIVEMWGGGTSASIIKGWAQNSSLQKRLVPVTTLDRIAGSRLHNKRSLILVDVEGAENDVIAGAEAVLSQEPKPIWIVEISINEQLPQGVKINPSASETFRRFWDHGYASWSVGQEIQKVTRSEIERIVDSRINTLESHNILFLESGRVSRT